MGRVNKRKKDFLKKIGKSGTIGKSFVAHFEDQIFTSGGYVYRGGDEWITENQ